jgi:hypothetical protein
MNHSFIVLWIHVSTATSGCHSVSPGLSSLYNRTKIGPAEV